MSGLREAGDERARALARFNAKCVTDGNCIVFTGTKTTWKHDAPGHGYGRFHAFGRGWRAHRFAWEMKRGPIPDGMVVCHHCDNPSCVNVEHLFIGTQYQNVHDSISKGRHHRPLKNTHCQQGHALTTDNVTIRHNKFGWPYQTCKQCARERVHAQWPARRAKLAERKRIASERGGA